MPQDGKITVEVSGDNCQPWRKDPFEPDRSGEDEIVVSTMCSTITKNGTSSAKVKDAKPVERLPIVGTPQWDA